MIKGGKGGGEGEGAARERATAVCVLLSQDNYSLQVTQVWRALRKTVKNTIIKKTEQNHTFQENQSNTNARCKYTLVQCAVYLETSHVNKWNAHRKN